MSVTADQYKRLHDFWSRLSNEDRWRIFLWLFKSMTPQQVETSLKACELIQGEVERKREGNTI